MYWRAWEMVWGSLCRPQTGSGFIVPYLAQKGGKRVNAWDCAFAAQFGVYARHAFDLSGGLDNIYARQHPDGYLPGEMDAGTGNSVYCPYEPNSTAPNILAWAEWRLYRATGDDGRLSRVFWPLLAYHQWCRRNRTWPDGTYWATGISSQMLNQPRVPDSMYHHRHWSWLDATVQAALSCQRLAQMTAQIGQSNLAEPLNQERADLARLVNEKMWSADSNFYHDVDPDGRFSPVKSIGAYWALLDSKLIPDNRLAPFIQHLRESWAFKLPHRTPTLSSDSEGYNSQTGHDWRGAVWPAANYMVLKGLRAVHQPELAHQIAANHLGMVREVFQHTDTFWENYAPESAAAGDPAEPNDVIGAGLTAVAIFLEDVIGISVDWPQKRVNWDRRLVTDEAYGVRNYPVGAEGTLDLLGDPEKIVVTTDVPFTLEIHTEALRLKTAVPAGTTEIDLT